jgi:hypothetical protein
LPVALLKLGDLLMQQSNGRPSEFKPPNLPVVNALVNRLRSDGFRFDRSTDLVCVQHLLATNITLFEAMFELGVDPARTTVLGKGYSDSPICIGALRKLGATALPAEGPGAPGWYESSRESEIRRFWHFAGSRVRPDRRAPILLGDVGGRLMLHVSDMLDSSPIDRKVVAVEQTSNGLRRVGRNAFRLPTVNLARAAAKCVHESRILANGILDRLDQEAPGSWPQMHVCVIGRGPVGNAMAAALADRHIPFEIFDELDAGEGENLLQQAVNRSDLIFGCTGHALFCSWPISVFRDGQVLVSCSSEDVEFSALLRSIPAYPRAGWPAPHSEIPLGSGALQILRGGFPFNFDDSGVSLPEQEIQITTALTLAAFATAAGYAAGFGSGSMLIEIPDELQQWIIGKAEELKSH